MSVTPFGTIDPYRRLSTGDFGTLLDPWFRNISSLMSPVGMGNLDNFSPHIDVTESANTIYVNAEMPGVKKEDVKMELRDGCLWIEAKKDKQDDYSDVSYRRRERAFGNFSAQVALPRDVDPKKFQVKWTDGVLTVTVPKPEGQSTPIPIE